MKKVLLLAILLFVSQSLMAQDSQNSAEPAPPDSSTPNEETVAEDTDPPPAIWPKSFEPSEEIGADSQISFPTDI